MALFHSQKRRHMIKFISFQYKMRVFRTYVVPGILFVCAVLMISLLTFHNSVLIQAITNINLEQIFGWQKVNATISPDAIMIPDDDTLNRMNETQHMKLYQKYIQSLQALCRQVIRIGSMKDGGKEICVDEAYKPKAPCLVYSFGINNQWDFDNQVVDHFGCEVHCFDPSMNRQSGRVSEKIWFYNVGLGAEDYVDERKWEIRTLDQIMRDLKHENRTIDILKIDIEGDEWKAITQMHRSGVLNQVKQLSIETHFSMTRYGQPTYWGHVNPSKQLSQLRQLYEAGFRIIMRERNLLSLQKWLPFIYPLTNVNEITLLHQ